MGTGSYTGQISWHSGGSVNILTFDLGSTTGWACLSDTGKLLSHGQYTDREFMDVTFELIRRYDPGHIVVEEPVLIRGPLGDTLRNVADQLRLLAPGAVYVRPS